MSRRSIPPAACLPALLLMMVVVQPDGALAADASCRVITVWNAQCSGGTRYWWDNMVIEWYDAITDGSYIFGHGPQAYGRRGSKINGAIVDSDFTDASVVSWGNDAAYGRPDAADAYMIGLHGIDYSVNGRWLARVRVDESGSGNCNSYQRHMQFGDFDLEFLHLSSCFSMDSQDWWSEWNGSFDGAHQIDGFHGIMWIGSGRVGDYRDFADDAFWTSISSAWLDNMYDNNASNGYDQCPVARNVGSNSADSSIRMSFERYNLVFSDPPGLGTPRNHRVRYIQGCDPKGKGAL
ncbi:MAG: DUF6345 domain-containing protein [Candidatus Eiseniibacteriota bacterium]|jgi:hypothetical protein